MKTRILFFTPSIRKRCRPIHINQANKPWKCNLGLGISTTARFLPTVAMEPLSWYSYSYRPLDLLSILFKLSYRLSACAIATEATWGWPLGHLGVSI